MRDQLLYFILIFMTWFMKCHTHITSIKRIPGLKGSDPRVSNCWTRTVLQFQLRIAVENTDFPIFPQDFSYITMYLKCFADHTFTFRASPQYFVCITSPQEETSVSVTRRPFFLLAFLLCYSHVLQLLQLLIQGWMSYITEISPNLSPPSSLDRQLYSKQARI